MKNKHPEILKTLYKIFKGLGIILISIVVLLLVIIFIARGINKVKTKITSENGIQEELYIKIGGIEQSIQIRGEDIKNPLILFLHGGPGSPHAYVSHHYQSELEEDYTIVNWDQRGSGRTYYVNSGLEVTPELSTEVFINDLDELVDYLNNRFGKNSVIIMGHSWGTILGSIYTHKYPEKVSSYIGIAQVISLLEGDSLAVNEAIKLAKEDDNQEYIDKLLPLYEKFSASKAHGEFDFDSHANIRQLTNQYLSSDDSISTLHSFWLAASSPNMTRKDLKWFFKMAFKPNEFADIQRPLLQSLFEFNLYEYKSEYELPVYFISGDYDWITPYLLLEEYYETITAPDKDIILIENAGHASFMDNPKGFSLAVKKFLANIRD